MGLDTAPTADAARSATRRLLLGLLLPADPARDVQLLAVADSSVAISDALGGGLIDEIHHGIIDGHPYRIYANDDSAAHHPPANPRATQLLARLAHPHQVVRLEPHGDILALGAACHGDRDVPGALLAVAALL